MRRSNLPMPLTPLIGREQDVAAIQQLLERNEVRLVTLVGPAGVGKTRLALQVAGELIDRHGDGAFLVGLQDVREPRLLPHSIAAALGWPDTPDMPADATLVERLADRELLLVLDNVEQLLPAAAHTIAELLRAAPRLTVLATSRAPLRIRGEQEYSVPPLGGGPVGSIADQLPPAIELFLERARAGSRDNA